MLAFAAMTGVSFSLAYRYGLGQSQDMLGVSFLNLFLQNINATIQMWISILSAILTVFFIYRLAGFFREVYENKFFGIAIALLGFFGSVLVVFSSQVSNTMILGVAFWIGGLIIVFYKKRIKNG